MNYGDTRLPERFWEKVYPEPNTGCWLWGASANNRGYGWFGISKGNIRTAHTVMCRAVFGEPSGTKVNTLHSCDQRLCVNPNHLRWGSYAENSADATSRGRTRNKFMNVTHCVNGHEFTPENTYLHKRGRTCRSCSRVRNLRYYHEKKERV